ncbi:CGNR zinc finger domain-containing protein [Streptomyces sp. ME19-03-3]|nr:CGNR zinc finger domain-containing protein [Streptomyces sp. ME19-03-3]
MPSSLVRVSAGFRPARDQSSEGVAPRFDPGAPGLEPLPAGGPAPTPLTRSSTTSPAWSDGRWSPGRAPTRTLSPSPRRTSTVARRLRDALCASSLPGRRGSRSPPRTASSFARPTPASPGPASRPRRGPHLAYPGRRHPGAGGRRSGRGRALPRPQADRVRERSGHARRPFFVDTSRPGRRRWCSMEHCGNRHKVRAHRAHRAHRSRREAYEAPEGQCPCARACAPPLSR